MVVLLDERAEDMKDIYHNNSKDLLDLFSTFLDTQSGFIKNRNNLTKSKRLKNLSEGKWGGVL